MRRPQALAVALALLAGCRSDAERLLDLRTELRSKIDGLYAAYGGGPLAAQASPDAQKPDRPDDGSSTASRLFGELDRSYFESYCLARGRGERPFNLSGKLETFMKDPAHEEACREAAKLELRIVELEAKTAR